MVEKDELSDELAFLKELFLPKKEQKYLFNARKLSSCDPMQWEGIDFPLEMALELTNHCNLRCVMCPVPQMKRKRGYMEKEIFKKTVIELSKESGFLFLPQGFGEPLLHKEYYQLIGFAHDAGICPILVLSNGLRFEEEASYELMDLVDAIVITIDGTTAETYESVRVNSSFKIVMENIHRFLKIRGSKKTPRLVLRIIRMKATEAEIEDFRSQWSAKIGAGDIIQVADYNDWAGNVQDMAINKNSRQKVHRPCRMLWKNLTVYFDGRVSPCCYDSEGALVIGDVSRESLKDIWNSPRLRRLRDIHLKHEFSKIPLCSRCTSPL